MQTALLNSPSPRVALCSLEWCVPLARRCASVRRRCCRRSPRGRRPSRTAPGSGVDAALLLRALREWRYIAGLALDGVGFVLQIAALRSLPIYTVGAALAASLAVTAVVAAWLLHVRLSGLEWGAVAVVCAGLAMLGLASGEEGDEDRVDRAQVRDARHRRGRAAPRRAGRAAARAGAGAGARTGCRVRVRGGRGVGPAHRRPHSLERSSPTRRRTPCCWAEARRSCFSPRRSSGAR